MFKKFLNVILILSCGATLTGCALAAVGGAGATYWGLGEYNKAKGKQKKSLEKRVTRETRSQLERERVQTLSRDEQVAGKINGRLISGELTKVIEIHTLVRDGVVYLYGNVPSGKVAERAIKISRSQKGVRDVVSYLSVVEMKITPIIGGKEVQLSDNALEPRKRPGRVMNKEVRPKRPANPQYRLPQNPSNNTAIIPPSSPQPTQYNLVPTTHSDLRGQFNPLNIAPPLSGAPSSLMASAGNVATPLPIDDINTFYARKVPPQPSVQPNGSSPKAVPYALVAAPEISGKDPVITRAIPTSPNENVQQSGAYDAATQASPILANPTAAGTAIVGDAAMKVVTSIASEAVVPRLSKLSIHEFKIPADARGINHYVSNGEVLLYGTVANREVEAKAIKIAKGIKGVKNVISKLKITEKEKSQIIREADRIINKMTRRNKIIEPSLAIPTEKHKKVNPINVNSGSSLEPKKEEVKTTPVNKAVPVKSMKALFPKAKKSKEIVVKLESPISPKADKVNSKNLAVPPNYTMSQYTPNENMDVDEFGNMIVPSSGLLIIPNAGAREGGYSYQ